MSGQWTRGDGQMWRWSWTGQRCSGAGPGCCSVGTHWSVRSSTPIYNSSFKFSAFSFIRRDVLLDPHPSSSCLSSHCLCLGLDETCPDWEFPASIPISAAPNLLDFFRGEETWCTYRLPHSRSFDCSLVTFSNLAAQKEGT